MTREQQGFKDPTRLTQWTRWFLYAQVVVATVAMVSGVLEYQLLSDFKNGAYSSRELAMAAATASDNRQFVIAVGQIVVFIITGVFILRWIYRANYNARRLGATDMRFTPGWSVGWYFIPIANLWKPYQAMREIWKTSCDPRSWRSQPVSSLLSWWWFFWIVTSLLNNVALRVSMRTDDIDQIIAANIASDLADGSTIPLSLIAVAMITRIYTMQMSHAGKAGPESIGA